VEALLLFEGFAMEFAGAAFEHGSAIGVGPLRQRQGIRAGLLKEASRCDREGRRAYLEATNEDGRTLLWPMVREPR
jgi:hypothetical protein